jgi:hypothetical protein
MRSAESGRITFLDTFRFAAVTFALVAHVATQHGLDDFETSLGLLRASVTRAATPSLLILFGVMLEIVYARRFRAEPGLVAGRMVRRAALCYAAFAASALFALAGGKITASGLAGAVVLVKTVPYSAIFKLYLFLLLLGVGIVAARVRYGMAGLLALLCAVWLADTLVIDGSRPLPPPFRHLAGLLLGWGENHGPSVLHGVTLVVFGMALGAAAFSRTPPSRATWAALGLMLAAATAVLARELWVGGLRHVLVGIADIEAFRSDNAPVYYAYGIWVALALTGFAYLLHAAAPARLRRLMGRLGSATLPYFFIGNAVLLLSPSLELGGALASAAAVAAHLLAFGVLTLLWLDWARDNPLLVRAGAWGGGQAQAWAARGQRALTAAGGRET